MISCCNAIIVTILAALWASPAAPQSAPPEDQPQEQPSTQPADPQPSTLRRPEQARILEQLIRDAERPRPVIPDISTPLRAPDGRHSPDLLPEGTMLVERAGRLLRSGDRVAFEMQLEPPIGTQTLRLLPNAWLESMEREAAQGISDFVISAEVTRYRGENYLLVRKVRRHHSHGNLGP